MIDHYVDAPDFAGNRHRGLAVLLVGRNEASQRQAGLELVRQWVLWLGAWLGAWAEARSTKHTTKHQLMNQLPYPKHEAPDSGVRLTSDRVFRFQTEFSDRVFRPYEFSDRVFRPSFQTEFFRPSFQTEFSTKTSESSATSFDLWLTKRGELTSNGPPIRAILLDLWSQ